MEHVYLSRRNLLTLLSKLDRVKEGQASACTIIKRDTEHERFSQSLKEIMVTAVEDKEYYIDRMPGMVHPLDERDFESKTLEDLVREFIRLLEIREVSDNEVEFSPTKITSCRVMDLQRIQKLIEQMKARII